MSYQPSRSVSLTRWLQDSLTVSDGAAWSRGGCSMTSGKNMQEWCCNDETIIRSDFSTAIEAALTNSQGEVWAATLTGEEETGPHAVAVWFHARRRPHDGSDTAWASAEIRLWKKHLELLEEPHRSRQQFSVNFHLTPSLLVLSDPAGQSPCTFPRRSTRPRRRQNAP